MEAINEGRKSHEKTSEEMLYNSMQQAYHFFMENDDESKDVVIQEINDEMGTMTFLFASCVVQENQQLEGELARYELRKQDLEDEVRVLANVGKEIPQVCLDWFFFIMNSCKSKKRCCCAIAKSSITSLKERIG